MAPVTCDSLTGWTQGSPVIALNSGFGNPSPCLDGSAANSSYCYADLGGYPSQILIDMYAGSLNDFFFMCNSSGHGQLVRNECRAGNKSGYGTSTSWTSWVGPSSGPTNPANAWNHFQLDLFGQVAGVSAGSVNVTINGVFVATIASLNALGTYIGVQSDGLATGGAYWDNLVVRFAAKSYNISQAVKRASNF